MICLHHNDLDGRCAAAIVVKEHAECECLEVNYDKPLPMDLIENGEQIVIVDFTPNTKEDFQNILDKADGNVIWIDHHQKNIEKYPEFDDILGIRADTKPSGALLTWQYMFADKLVPYAVDLVSDYDTWTHAFKESKYFNAGMAMHDASPRSLMWQNLLWHDVNTVREVENVISKGMVITEYQASRAKKYIKDIGCEVKFMKYKTIVCNIGMVNSTFFDSVKDAYDIFMPYYFNGRQWVVSMYTEEENINLASIAQQFGGGGHKKAAGMVVDYLPFEKETE